MIKHTLLLLHVSVCALQLLYVEESSSSAAGEEDVTHLRKTVSPVRTVMLSITLLSDWESPWLRTGNPAGTRSKILRDRSTEHLDRAVKYPRIDIVSSPTARRDTESVNAPVEIIYPQFISPNPDLRGRYPRCADRSRDWTRSAALRHCNIHCLLRRRNNPALRRKFLS